jgi:hypothetical protein
VGGERAAVIIYNTRTTPLRVNLNQLGAAYDGAAFHGIWHGEGTHVVEHGALHNIEVPARDVVILIQQPV